jgi:FkbH-like protein
MYETEANSRTESASQLPAEALSRFAEMSAGQLLARTALPWSEHCTECLWPACYATCDLYSPRQDGRCRRFVDGMVRIDHPAAPNGYLLKISFKRWGKLWTPGSARLLSAQQAAAAEKWDRRVGSTLVNITLPQPLKTFASGKRYSYKKRVARGSVFGNGHSSSWTANGNGAPTSFVVECFNPNDDAIALSLVMRSDNPQRKIPFQKLLPAAPGFNRFRIPVAEIESIFDLSAPFGVEITRNEIPDGTTLFFGIMDFIREAPKPETSKTATDKPTGEKKEKTVKCVVWDLDHTLWEGILVEDGADKLQLRPGVLEVITELDRRGILLSIASKNNADDALKVLKSFGLDDYFLYPQISWGPKSEGIKAIAKSLNIGVDRFLFIDDSPFELEQVQSTCPGVRVLNASEYLSLPVRKECQAEVTEEASRRRAMYREESVRQEAASGFSGDYFEFLRGCDIKLNIRPMTAATIQRVHELTQRTNQMNFSGNRYDRSVLEQILNTPYLHTFVLECEDRFGSYGAVGFSVVDSREPRMTDLAFSCRIQSKRVEHAFVSYLIRKYTAETGKHFYANYRKTPRNAPSGQVFADMGMEETAVTDGVTSLIFQKDRVDPDDKIIKLIFPDDAAKSQGSRPAPRDEVEARS